MFGNPLTSLWSAEWTRGAIRAEAIDLCHVGDPLCGRRNDLNGHNEYVPGLTDQAATFVAGLV